ncbi:28S ribosomal mitochondrial [Chlorella sorokiniana]|jgi:ribosomal protein S21|uniref:28S ribosomal mitochondrial n=1 Tax=Chlorella sorokiniana TaxID=3076 RepID=A0A2P6TS89_CHLSO|nr:28S ribosomal mitochondrial [Chlorella sorokiniana]|eukprot:PRW56918.1 28S ribosomal mitochondrial [Chlorella sorokiniana]
MALRRAAAAVMEACSISAAPLAAARPQVVSAAATSLQQARSATSGVVVDVPNGNVDKAWRTLTRKLREERYMETAQERVHFVKPSQRRKQEASLAAKRFKQQEFKQMLQWIMRRRAGGF